MSQPPKWPGAVLKLAAIYNLLWGAWVICFPNHLFSWAGIEQPNYPGIWQCVGMIVGVYGIGYWFAARDFRIHWPVVLVGFLGKIFGPIGFVQSALTGALPWSWGITIVFNDLIWWWPFGAMLFLAFKHHSDPKNRKLRVDDASLSAAIPILSSAQELDDFLGSSRKRLLVFIRHAGCTFCRETLAKIESQRSQLQKADVEPVVVHMSTLDAGNRMMKSHGLSDVVHVSDPDCTLYQKFGLKRGTFLQLFGPSVWWNGLKAAIFQRHGFGKLEGDGFQLGGSVLIQNGKVLASYPCENASSSLPSSQEINNALECKL
jgi:peroxiredoxin